MCCLCTNHLQDVKATVTLTYRDLAVLVGEKRVLWHVVYVARPKHGLEAAGVWGQSRRDHERCPGATYSTCWNMYTLYRQCIIRGRYMNNKQRENTHSDSLSLNNGSAC